MKTKKKSKGGSWGVGQAFQGVGREGEIKILKNPILCK